jgi:tetratricopeptide (TPR) repeat protein
MLLLTLSINVQANTSDAEEFQRELELDLRIAQAAFAVAPDREESYIWLGRRYGYLGRYADAIEVFTDGLEKFPDSYKLLRFRARHLARHREFERAIADYKLGLRKMEGVGDSFEPNGIINAIELPTSTYRQNLHYYLGQTSFAIGDYQQMFDHLEHSKRTLIDLPYDDHSVAVAFWQYIALHKLGKHDQAEALFGTLHQPIRLLENHTYYEALLVLIGARELETVRQQSKLVQFARAMRHQFDGEHDAAQAIFRSLSDPATGGFWPAEVARSSTTGPT